MATEEIPLEFGEDSDDVKPPVLQKSLAVMHAERAGKIGYFVIGIFAGSILLVFLIYFSIIWFSHDCPDQMNSI